MNAQSGLTATMLRLALRTKEEEREAEPCGYQATTDESIIDDAITALHLDHHSPEARLYARAFEWGLARVKDSLWITFDCEIPCQPASPQRVGEILAAIRSRGPMTEDELTKGFGLDAKKVGFKSQDEMVERGNYREFLFQGWHYGLFARRLAIMGLLRQQAKALWLAEEILKLVLGEKAEDVLAQGLWADIKDDGKGLDEWLWIVATPDWKTDMTLELWKDTYALYARLYDVETAGNFYLSDDGQQLTIKSVREQEREREEAA